ncbi:MAG TPA: DUF4232 domain-containing protein [Streptosporangiaceae bacterium]|nr:DUF4232 domain-containing protein [Streptosporangiaceae bacterium]
MDDEQLREELSSWLRPEQQAPVPGIEVIRRRLRRRRASTAAAWAAVVVAAAGSAVVIHAAGGRPAVNPRHYTTAAAPACTLNNIRIGWSLAPGQYSGTYMEPPPIPYLLTFSNAGRTACSLAGWPRLTVAQPRALRTVPIIDGTVSIRWVKNGTASRVIEPTRVRLAPGGSAVATVTVDSGITESDCAGPLWEVGLPQGGGAASLRPAGRATVNLCHGSTVDVSPVYPSGVPVTQNYPRSVPAQSPAVGSTTPPSAGATPAAAPYFVVVDTSRSPSPAVVYDWRTGKAVATVQPPSGVPGGFTGVAGAGDDAMFVLAAGQTHSRFYQLVLGRGGLPQPAGYRQNGPVLQPLPVPPVATPHTPFAVSDDGSELALALPQPGGNAEVTVVDLVSGSMRTWRSPGPGSVTGLSWSDPGSSPAVTWTARNQLAFVWTASTPGRAAASQSGLRMLALAGPRGDLLGVSRLLIPATVRVGALRGLSDPLVSSGGTVVFVTMTSHVSGARRAAVVEFDAHSGRALRMVTPTVGGSGVGTWCGALWANPTGSYALAACGVQGQVSDGRFTRVDLHFPAASAAAGLGYFGW